MPIVDENEHVTTCRYDKPVTLGEHRAMFRPRGSHAGRILGYKGETSVPSRVHRLMDTLANSVAVIDFETPTTALILTCRVQGIQFGSKGIQAFPLDGRARDIPVRCTPDGSVMTGAWT
jgi:hypothetical protein